MATHSSILAWRIPWPEEPGSCSPRGHTQSDTTEVTMRQSRAILIVLLCSYHKACVLKILRFVWICKGFAYHIILLVWSEK